MIIGFFQVFDSRCSSSLLLLSLIEVLCTFDNQLMIIDNDWCAFDNQLMIIDNHLCSFDNQLMSSYSTPSSKYLWPETEVLVFILLSLRSSWLPTSTAWTSSWATSQRWKWIWAGWPPSTGRWDHRILTYTCPNTNQQLIWYLILGDVVFGLSYHHGCCHCSAMGQHRPHEVRHEDDRCLMLIRKWCQVCWWWSWLSWGKM